MGLHFSKEEFASRKSKVLKSMKEQDIDALIMFKQESMYWLTGYDTFGYVFFQTLVLDQKGNIVLLTRAPDLRQAQNTSNIEDIKIWVDKDGSNPTDDLTKAYTRFEVHQIANKNLSGIFRVESLNYRDSAPYSVSEGESFTTFLQFPELTGPYEVSLVETGQSAPIFLAEGELKKVDQGAYEHRFINGTANPEYLELSPQETGFIVDSDPATKSTTPLVFGPFLRFRRLWFLHEAVSYTHLTLPTKA